MTRALEPHTPGDDLDALLAHRARGAVQGVLTPDLEAFCQSGVSVCFAAALPGEIPAACVGHGCRILGGERIRLLLPVDGGARVMDLAARGARLAATFSQTYSHRSIQLKGSGPQIVPATDEDREEARRQKNRLAQDLVSIGFSLAVAEAYCHVEPADVAVIEFLIEAAFAQTPGPGAGAALI